MTEDKLKKVSELASNLDSVTNRLQILSRLDQGTFLLESIDPSKRNIVVPSFEDPELWRQVKQVTLDYYSDKLEQLQKEIKKL